MEDDRVRINKYLASCGVCSRREADLLLLTGRVLLNGTVPSSGAKVSSLDFVTLDGMPVRPVEEKLLVAYHKPYGTTCTTRDAHAFRTVYDDVQVFVDEKPVRLSYVGRLDRDSEGLLLFTNDGELIERVTKGKFHQEKEYLVAVTLHDGDTETIAAKTKRLSAGVFLKDLARTTLPCTVEEVTGKEAEAFLQHLPDGTEGITDGIRRTNTDDFHAEKSTGEMEGFRAVHDKRSGYYFRNREMHVLRFILTQGMNRQIRRMCETVGLKVFRLQRIRVMNILLGDLAPGAWRYLTDAERDKLMEMAAPSP